MEISKRMKVMVIGMFFSILSGLFLRVSAVFDDLEAIRQQGFLRHLGVPYANFITNSGDGFSVELIQRFADSPLKPIIPGDTVETDIAAVKAKLSGISVLGMSGICVDRRLYHLANYDAGVILHQGNLNELAPAVMNGLAESTLLDVPDSLVALHKWPNAFKVIGPVTQVQNMGVGFRKESLQLREQFNAFLQEFRKNGHYLQLVQKYYPTAIYYFENFFKK